MSGHQVQWTAPSPLWPQTWGPNEEEMRAIFRQPAILRFASDSFMDDFFALLDRDPAQLTAFIAQPGETWSTPISPPQMALTGPGGSMSSFERKLHRLRLVKERWQNGWVPSASADKKSSDKTLKLYQPAHQRYYLVAGCLICRPTVLGDHKLNTALQERVSFVVRRLFPPEKLETQKALPPLDSSWEEYAFVSTPAGNRWQRIPQAAQFPSGILLPGEERLPLFPTTFLEEDGRKRRLFVGLVPVGKREAYMGAAQRLLPEDPAPDPPTKTEDPRMLMLRSQVLQPWKSLIDVADRARIMQTGQPPAGQTPVPSKEDGALPDDARAVSLKATREQIQTISWYILLDLAKFLETYISNVWKAVTKTPGFVLTDPDEISLFEALQKTGIHQDYAKDLKNLNYSDEKIVRSLQDALVAIRGGAPLNQPAKQIEDNLERVTISYDRDKPDEKWPSFLFPLADSVYDGPLPPPAEGKAENADPVQRAFDCVENLSSSIEKALPPQPPDPLASIPLAAQPVMDPREGWFVIRCVFERPFCGPELQPAVVSEPTQSFQLAGFFDPDAPARPIRIGLPLDTSPAGLRKFDKNTAFMISDILCGQIERVKGLSLGDLVRSVLPWPLHKDLSVKDPGPCKTDAGLQMGVICSLSIPIVTICALILLMIIVSILDYIFRWIPYFMICFPLPGFKGKKS